MSQNSLEGNGGPSWPASCLSLGAVLAVLPAPMPFLLPCRPGYEISHQFVQIEGEDRAGTCHLQRLPQTFLGLVESIFVRLQGTNDAFSLATFAPDRLPDVLGNVPAPAGPWAGCPAVLTPSWASTRQRCGGIAAPIVDQQRGGGVRPKDRAVPRQRLGIFDSVTHASDQGSKDIPTAEATQEIRQTKLHLFPRLVAHKCPRLCYTGMHDFALSYDPRGDPLHNLRHEALGHFVPRRECGDGVVGHTLATLAQPLDQQHESAPSAGPPSVSRRVNTCRFSCLPLANRWCSLTDLRIVWTCVRAASTPHTPCVLSCAGHGHSAAPHPARYSVRWDTQ